MTDLLTQELVRVIREDFSEYILDDGNTLRVKGVLINFSLTVEEKTNKEGKIGAHVQYQTQPVGGVLNTAKIDTSALEQRDPSTISASDNVSKIGFKPKKIVLNLYETEEFLIIGKYVLQEVWTTKYKDNASAPIYRYSGGLIFDAIGKDTLAPIPDIQKEPTKL